jgi:hypothetical protein
LRSHQGAMRRSLPLPRCNCRGGRRCSAQASSGRSDWRRAVCCSAGNRSAELVEHRLGTLVAGASCDGLGRPVDPQACGFPPVGRCSQASSRAQVADPSRLRRSSTQPSWARWRMRLTRSSKVAKIARRGVVRAVSLSASSSRTPAFRLNCAEGQCGRLVQESEAYF